MLKQSFDGVEVTWLDQAKITESIKAAVLELARSHPEIEEVLLFGSMARNEAAPGSDADLLIILSEEKRTFLERVTDHMIANDYVDVDVFPYTRDELKTMLDAGNHFVKNALAEGIGIYKRAS